MNTFIARFARRTSLVVALCLAPFRYPAREIVFIGWVGLRGAVPIVLATFPVLVGAPGADQIFHLVFFIVVVGAIIPGGTVAWATRRLGLESPQPPAPHALLAIESRVPLQGDLMSFYIDEALVVCGLQLDELDFPDGASVALIVRGDRLVAPKGGARLERGEDPDAIESELGGGGDADEDLSEYFNLKTRLLARRTARPRVDETLYFL